MIIIRQGEFSNKEQKMLRRKYDAKRLGIKEGTDAYNKFMNGDPTRKTVMSKKARGIDPTRNELHDLRTMDQNLNYSSSQGLNARINTRGQGKRGVINQYTTQEKARINEMRNAKNLTSTTPKTDISGNLRASESVLPKPVPPKSLEITKNPGMNVASKTSQQVAKKGLSKNTKIAAGVATGATALGLGALAYKHYKNKKKNTNPQ
jgi:hypothetical protein